MHKKENHTAEVSEDFLVSMNQEQMPPTMKNGKYIMCVVAHGAPHQRNVIASLLSLALRTFVLLICLIQRHVLIKLDLVLSFPPASNSKNLGCFILFFTIR